VSVGRTTALDGFTNNHNFSHLSNLDDHFLHQPDFSSFFDAPKPTESDHQFIENGLPHLTDNFNLDSYHMDSHNDSFFDNEIFADFLNHDDQLATETQSSDKLAETTASLQPQLGASFDGCDSGGNAVSV
jgi:transcriptional activator HAC1